MRNCKAMIDARRKKSQAVKQRVLETVKILAEQGKPLTIANIAKHAHVSRVYLYKHADILSVIEQARSCPVSHTTEALLRRCTDLEQQLALAQARFRHLEFKRIFLENEIRRRNT